MRLGRPAPEQAVVVPDNCLFADQAAEVFKILTEDAELHTVLRLTNGTFTPYSPGTKTNVVFFTKVRPTEETWIYDLSSTGSPSARIRRAAASIVRSSEPAAIAPHRTTLPVP
jgi:type I restriction-modification system DNA methylase subunit